MAEQVTLGFACGHGLDRIELLGVEGHERIHRPFELDLVLGRFGPALTREEIEKVIGARALVAFGPAPLERMHGVVTSLTHVDSPRGSFELYVAKMVPEIALLQAGRRSAIYQSVTVPDLVREVLTAHGLSLGDDFELRTAGVVSPSREYVVQYRESDWDFLARWMEHEGLYLVFEHLEEHSRAIVCGEVAATPELGDPAAIAYRANNNLSSEARGTIWDVWMMDSQLPHMVSVTDYNYRRPAEVLFAAQGVTHGTFGHVASFGDHVKDRDEAAAIARVRAEEIGARRRTLSGTTDRAALRAGMRFQLELHPHAEYDGSYLVVESRLQAGIPVPRPGQPAHIGEARRYRSTLTAIPTSSPFRPERTTPWPSIAGILHGHVQGDGAGQHAEIDDWGRYKIRMPFDLATKHGLGASRWVRKAQPYAGAGYGQHFPLHKGTEVLIAHLDGNPDRPVIVGAVPHAATPSPVSSANASQSVIQTATGIRIELEDRQP